MQQGTRTCRQRVVDTTTHKHTPSVLTPLGPKALQTTKKPAGHCAPTHTNMHTHAHTQKQTSTHKHTHTHTRARTLLHYNSVRMRSSPESHMCQKLGLHLQRVRWKSCCSHWCNCPQQSSFPSLDHRKWLLVSRTQRVKVHVWGHVARVHRIRVLLLGVLWVEADGPTKGGCRRASTWSAR